MTGPSGVPDGGCRALTPSEPPWGFPAWLQGLSGAVGACLGARLLQRPGDSRERCCGLPAERWELRLNKRLLPLSAAEAGQRGGSAEVTGISQTQLCFLSCIKGSNCGENPDLLVKQTELLSREPEAMGQVRVRAKAGSSARPAALGTGLMRGCCPGAGTSRASPGFGLATVGAGTTFPRPFPSPSVQGPGPGRVWGRLSTPSRREWLQGDRPEPRRDGEPGRGQLPRPGAQQPAPLRQELLLPEERHLHPVRTPRRSPLPGQGGVYAVIVPRPSIVHSLWDGCRAGGWHPTG